MAAQPVRLEKKTPLTREQILARVTGADRKRAAEAGPPVMGPGAPPAREKLPMPKAARPLPPGVTGTLPMPTNKVVGTIAPSSLTPREREALEGIGWTEDIPIPEDFAKSFDSIKAEYAAAQIDLPVDPRTPKAKMDTIPIEQAPPEARARVRDLMTRMAEDRKAEIEAERAQTEAAARGAAIPGLQQARQAADKAATAADRAAAEMEEEVFEYVEGQKVAAAPAAAPPHRHDPSPTGADAVVNCPHCGGDPTRPDGIEPDNATKQAFLHCMLGNKPFTQAVDLFGGAVTVTFRSLTSGELNALYQQAHFDRLAQQIESEVDYWELINQYRLCLQIVGLTAHGPAGVKHELPDGLDRRLNRTAQVVWQDGNDEPAAGETILPLVRDHVMSDVLAQESVCRVVTLACNRFNRLTAKLEAMADNSDFWRPTGARS